MPNGQIGHLQGHLLSGRLRWRAQKGAAERCANKLPMNTTCNEYNEYTHARSAKKNRSLEKSSQAFLLHSGRIGFDHSWPDPIEGSGMLSNKEQSKIEQNFDKRFFAPLLFNKILLTKPFRMLKGGHVPCVVLDCQGLSGFWTLFQKKISLCCNLKYHKTISNIS